MRKTKKLIALTLLIVCLFSIASCEKKEEAKEKTSESEISARKEDEKQLETVFNAIKTVIRDELTGVNTDGRMVPLDFLVKPDGTINPTEENAVLLATALFGEEKGVLAKEYALEGGKTGSVFKSEAAKGCKVYFGITMKGTVLVCLVSNGTIVEEIGDKGFVGDAVGATFKF